MKIALVPSAYAPAFGGVEQLTSRLAAHLVAAGDQVEVWTMRDPPDLLDRETVGGVPVRRFAFYLPPAKVGPALQLPVRAVAVLRSMLRAVHEFRPDVIHVQCFGANGVYALAVAALTRVPLVVSLQGETIMDDHDIYDRSASLRLALRAALKRAAAVTACSRFALAHAIDSFGRPTGPTEVVFNGVDMVEEDPPVPLPLPYERFVFAVGRVVYKKGFDLLLESMALLPDDLDDVAVVVGGAGPELHALRERSERLGLGSRAVFPGRLSRGQVAWAMARAEVFVLPSRVEPFGIVTLEAMRAGTPVVVSANGGASEIVRAPSEGLAVDPTDRRALACALTSLLRDPQMRQRVGRAGLQRAADFSWPTIAGSYRRLYRSLMAT
jgi:glycogen(starch) synthase